MLLRACPDVKFLVTSRCVLRIKGEHEQQLAPLRSPAAGVSSPSDLISFPSVELFAQRAEAVLPGWELDEDAAPAVAEICRRLDGLPLALELAAARLKILSPAALLERLGSQHDLLSRGTRDSDDRHRTLQATLDWSYQLLDAAAARLFPQLSVFAGGWTLDGLVAVCGAGDEGRGAGRPRRRSSTTASCGASASRPRRVSPCRSPSATTRPPGCAPTAVTSAAATRHLRWCLDLAEAAEAGLSGASQQSWLRSLADEHANLSAALEYAIAGRQPDAAHRLAGALWRYWEISGHFDEGRQWLRRVLELPPPASPAVQGRAFKAAGNLARDQGDLRRGHGVPPAGARAFHPGRRSRRCRGRAQQHGRHRTRQGRHRGRGLPFRGQPRVLHRAGRPVGHGPRAGQPRARAAHGHAVRAGGTVRPDEPARRSRAWATRTAPRARSPPWR